MAGWNAAVEFSQVTFHSAPDTLNVAAHAKVSCRVVIGFSGVAKPLHAIVTRMSVRDKMATSSYPYLKEQFNAILLGVGDNLQPQAPGVYFYTAHDNGCLPRLLWRCLQNHASSTATKPESSSPPSDGRCWRKRAHHRWMVV